MTDEEKNTEITEKLKNLPEIKAGDDFVLKLERRIAEYESGKNSLPVKKDSEGFFQRLFGQKRNQWFVPAMGLAAVAIFAVYITKFSNNQIDDKSEVKSNTQIERSTDEIKKDNSLLNKEDENSSENIQKETESKIEKNNLKNKISPAELNTENIQPNSLKPAKENINTEEKSSKMPEANFKGKVADSKEEITGRDKKPENKEESYNEGKAGMERSSILSSNPKINENSNRTSKDDMKDFEKPVEKNIFEKLNKINKQNLDSLKKKINK